MKHLLPIVSGLLIAAASPASATLYYGSTLFKTTFSTIDNMPDVNLALQAQATTDATVNIQNGTIQFGANNVSIPAVTYTGTQTFLNPSTLQNTPVSFSFTTSAVDFAYPATTALPLTANGASLDWYAYQPSVISFPLSGTYTISGPTETLTGTFGGLLQSTARGDGGTLSVNNDGTLNMTGDNAFEMVGSTMTIFNVVVDGVAVNLSISGSPSSIEEYSTGTFTSVPEASALGLALLGGAAFMRRRR